MPRKAKSETKIGVTAFKTQCLGLIDDVAKGRLERIVLLKHDRPVAVIVPIDKKPVQLWGAMAGSVTIVPGVDLTEPSGEVWDADR